MFDFCFHLQHTAATENSTATIVLEIFDKDETESDTEAFAAPPAPELELTKSTMLPSKEHKFGRTCSYLALGWDG